MKRLVILSELLVVAAYCAPTSSFDPSSCRRAFTSRFSSGFLSFEEELVTLGFVHFFIVSWIATLLDETANFTLVFFSSFNKTEDLGNVLKSLASSFPVFGVNFCFTVIFSLLWTGWHLSLWFFYLLVSIPPFWLVLLVRTLKVFFFILANVCLLILHLFFL